MTDLAAYILLGLLQGLTEFLPVSSSGHLVVLERLLRVDFGQNLLLEVVLHIGTLAAVIVVLRRELWRLVVDGLRGARLILRGRGGQVRAEAPCFGTALAVVVGTIPAALAGVLVKATVNDAIKDPRLASILIVVTGLLLCASRLAPAGTHEDVSPGKGFLVGLAQAVALLPGISRSGTTIIAGYFVGLKRETAARFSFLLAVPAIAGAGVVEVGLALLRHPGEAGALNTGDVVGLVCGAAAAGVVGWACLVLLFRTIRRGRLHWFAAYCIPAGLLFLVLSTVVGKAG